MGQDDANTTASSEGELIEVVAITIDGNRYEGNLDEDGYAFNMPDAVYGFERWDFFGIKDHCEQRGWEVEHFKQNEKVMPRKSELQEHKNP